MLWVLKRTVSRGRFFLASNTLYVKIDGLENIYNFTLKNFVYRNLWVVVVVFVLNVPPTAKVMWGRGHGLKSHPTDW